MQRKSRWLVAIGVTALAGVALLAALAPGAGPGGGVKADTPSATPTPTATPNPSLIATINAVPPTGQTNQQVTFTAVNAAGASTGAGGTYLWTYGDGASGAGNPSTHTYANTGTYLVQVIGSGAASGQATLQYTVIAGLAVSLGGPYNVGINQPVNFTATVTPAAGTVNPTDLTYTWSFGDGQTSAPTTTGAISHVYATSGTFTATVSVSSATQGRSGTATATVNISATSPTPTLSVSAPSQASTGQSLTFSVTASGTVPADYSYAWNFGDGSSSVGASVTHTYSNTGSFNVTVNATSAGTPGANTQSTATVTVSQAAPTGPTVTYQAGWNLVSGPGGTSFASATNPLYTLTATTGGAYASIPNTQALVSGQGYWAFFNAATTVSLNGASSASATVGAAPAGQYIMVGNPSATSSVTVTGADVVYTYTPAGGYVATTTLAPGQGAWALSNNGGTLTIR